MQPANFSSVESWGFEYANGH